MSNQNDQIVVKKEGVSKEELAKALEDSTKKILEAVTKKEELKSQAIVDAEAPGDYREALRRSIKSTDEKDNFKYTGKEDLELNEIKNLGQVRATEDQKKRMKEAIGAVTASNAVPEIWSSEVSRGCRYPESAFRQPYIGLSGNGMLHLSTGSKTCTESRGRPLKSSPSEQPRASTSLAKSRRPQPHQ